MVHDMIQFSEKLHGMLKVEKFYYMLDIKDTLYYIVYKILNI